ncbi:heat shock protein 27-like isoform X2 [Hermetia illucens]|nr:heat shock protein 27-like isoform X2 [Hermetia illucens]
MEITPSRERTFGSPKGHADDSKQSGDDKQSTAQTIVNVKQFKPEEISVRTVGNTVVIEGKHDERQDEYGLVSRHIVRKFTLPEGYDPKDVVSTFSPDGVLTIKAHPPAKPAEGVERVIPVQQTGPARPSLQDKKPENGDVKEKIFS